MKSILVTGGSGFLGSHLCEYLLKKGNRVLCLDNFFTGQRKNIKHLLKDKNFRLIKHDIIIPFEIHERIDQIYNLACPASPVHYQFNPIKTVKANTVGVINVLELAKKHKARVLQASTSEVYGDPLVHPQKEDYRGNVNTLGPRACYDEGKRVAETLMMDYHRHHNVNVKIIRIFNTYGPRMFENDGRVISNFIMQALRGEDITVYGNGSQTRSFCYVSDLIEGMYRMMNSEETGPINLGNPEEITILECAKRVIVKTNSKSKIIFKPLPKDDPIRRKPDITLAKKKLEWQPKVKFKEGLDAAVAYFSGIVKA
jgi:UDP-glucuronate decarboxylase